MIYEEPDSGFFVKLGLTQSGAFVLIEASDHETSEVHLLDRADSRATPRLVETREVGLQYDVEHHGDDLIILTNADGAEDFKIMRAPVADPGRARWTDLVPYRAGTMILFAMALSRYLVRLEREDAKPRIVVREFATGREETIGFEEDTYALGIDPGYEYDTSVIRYRYSSMTTPSEVTDLDLATGTRTLRKRQVVPSGHRPEDYVTRRLFATAHDGSQVPISVVHRRDVRARRHGALSPLWLRLLRRFHSGGLSHQHPVPRRPRLRLCHRPCSRRHGERLAVVSRRQAREASPTPLRISSPAARRLRRPATRRRGRIVAHGGSAGGMLMGAVANLAPDLFAGIVSEVPFVDVLNTMLDAELPLTPPEWPEWGNPAADEAAFRTILSYSPYDNVKAQAYPAVLALGRPDRSARDLLGARQMDRAPAPDDDRRGAGDAQAQHGSRPWRRRGTVRPARRGRADVPFRTSRY